MFWVESLSGCVIGRHPFSLLDGETGLGSEPNPIFKHTHMLIVEHRGDALSEGKTVVNIQC